MLDDKVLENPLFNTSMKEETEGFYENIETKLNNIGVYFPSFVTFDPVKEKNVISWDGSEFFSPGVEGFWENIENLYEFIENDLGHDADFDDSIYESGQVKDGVIGVSIPHKYGYRMLIGPVDTRNIEVFHYYSYLCLARTWLTKQDDFVYAYRFLNEHPVFWSRRSEVSTQWNTDSGLSSMWVHPTRNDKGETVVMLEHGAAVPDARTMHYHDMRLDIYEPTYEKAIIELAKRVHKFFYLDGEERPDVDYEKSQLEIELEERIKDFEEAQAQEQ